ncbi:hypothetical protein D3C71_2231790 [compost metagenome]
MQPFTRRQINVRHKGESFDARRLDPCIFTVAGHGGECADGLLLEQLLGTEQQPALPGTADRLQGNN